ncbi:MAG: aminoacyl-tRNA hydrolase [Polyangiaceae bacterium]|nr:aminoacyl-tRNA hydrolase [Polyangiaceae bacterium]
MSDDLEVGPLRVPEGELVWVAVRASGPGGQNVNKVSSKVELRFDFESSASLPERVRVRLRVLARTRLDGEGRILLTSQKTRDQRKNLEDARTKLGELLASALLEPKKRKATKPSFSSKVRRVDEKKRRGQTKAGRRFKDD